jgi:hypothetical protein
MKNIRWGWILLGGFLAELTIFVIVIPLSLVAGQKSLLYSAPPVSFAAAFVFGVWAARKASERRVVYRSASRCRSDSDISRGKSGPAGADGLRHRTPAEGAWRRGGRLVAMSRFRSAARA